MSSEIVKQEAVVGHLSDLGRPQWTRERVELLKRAVVPQGIGDDEFALFLEQCKRSGLDPLLKEAFCVPRNAKISKKGEPDRWGTKYEFQPSEAGMLARAERFPDFKGIQASSVCAEDEIVINTGKGEVTHTFNPAKRKGQLVGAWARVVREGKLPVVVWLDFAGYVQPTPLWSKIPTTMIEKCARVAALRKAYPEAFGGLYIQEEMPPVADDGQTAAPKPPTRKALPMPPEDPPSAADDAAIEAQFRSASQQVTGEAAPLPEEETHVIIGRHKGKGIAGLDDVSLSQAIEDADKIVSDPANKGKRSFHKASRAHAALVAERDFRKQAPPAEPGSEG